MSMWEIAALAVLALLIFGPERLPGMARTVGRTITTLRREASGTIDELKRATEIEELRKETAELRQATREVRGEVEDVGGEVAAAGREARGAVVASEAQPPPFDPDAT